MTNVYNIDTEKIVEKLIRFTHYIYDKNGKEGFLSFRDSSGYLGQEEDYKSRIAEEARKELNYKSWKESWIGTGKISECARKAMNRSGNLVNKNQQIDFKNRLNPDHKGFRQDAERVLYNLYVNPLCDDATAFKEATETFGAKYDTIAFLFFIKDDTHFLPNSPKNFDMGFAELGIDYKTAYLCSWENYKGFLSIISEIREIMEDVLPINGVLRLIDAHSFIWIIQQKRFITWTPNNDESIKIELEIEDHLQKDITGSVGRRRIVSNAYARSAAVAKETRKRAKGICQLCRQPAPFNDKKGEPYLEVHHIEWLSRGGEDSTANTAALCPNCHTRMHVLDDPDDINKLKEL